MADTNLLILAREFKNLRTKVQEVLKMPVGPQGLQGEKGEQGVKGDIGAPGKNGKDGKDGSKGLDGLNGKDGTDGIDGKDGVDGISVVDARVDFDGSLVLTLSNGTEIDAGKVSSEQVENVYAMLKNGAASLNELLPTQEGNANKYLKTDGTNTSWDTLDGSDINLSSPPPIGSTTPAAGTFTTLTATGQTSLGGVAGSESLRILTPAVTGAWAEFQSFAGSAQVYANAGSGSIDLVLNSRASGNVRLQTAGSIEQFRVSHTASAVNYVQVTGAATGGNVAISSQGSDNSVPILYQAKGGGSHRFITNNTIEHFRVAHATNAVNYVQVTGGATGSPGIVTISSQGSDTNTSLIFTNKGTGAFSWFNGGGTSSRLFRLNGGATNMANHLQIDAAAAGSAPTLSVGSLSSDTNVDLALTPKGTGNVRFGTYTGTALSIAGYIEIKDSGGTVRKLAVVA